MTDLPEAVVLENLHGPERGKHPALYFRDEIIWNASSSKFALAYTITEASYGNEIGCILWGALEGSESRIIENPKEVYACCWGVPWCRWIDDKKFVFKSQLYDSKKLNVPLVIVDFEKGFCVMQNTNNPDSKISEELPVVLNYHPMDIEGLRNAIREAI